MSKTRVLIVDDDDAVRNSLAEVLQDRGYETSSAENGGAAIVCLQESPWDVALVDLKMPDMTGIDVLKKIRDMGSGTTVIIITGYGTIEGAVEAVHSGAFDYITKPFTPDEIVMRVEKAVQQKQLVEENVYLKKTLEERYEFCNIIGTSKAMQEIFAAIEKVAPTDCSVLIQGESGTGKELIARAIHQNSLRKDRKFIAVDCGALPETLLESELFGHVKGSFTGAVVTKRGLLEVAHQGTFFMDEIGDLHPGIQAKLLRVLQEKEFRQVGGIQNIRVDIRLIAATNKDVKAMIDGGQFREDLFYRINTVPIHIPALRQRKEDIPLLAGHFLDSHGAQHGTGKKISPEVMNMLMEYEWPGNVRELEHAIEQMTIMCDGPLITAEHVPAHIRGSRICFDVTTPRTNEELKVLKKQMRERAVENIERTFVIEALKRNEWNISHAAREVGLKRQNFQALMRKHHITA